MILPQINIAYYFSKPFKNKKAETGKYEQKDQLMNHILSFTPLIGKTKKTGIFVFETLVLRIFKKRESLKNEEIFCGFCMEYKFQYFCAPISTATETR
jgi:hypothetical protein